MHVLERVEVVAIPHDRPMASSALRLRHGSINSRTDHWQLFVGIGRAQVIVLPVFAKLLFRISARRI